MANPCYTLSMPPRKGTPPTSSNTPIKITRSGRRTRTVTARPLPDGGIEILAPEDIPDAELQPIIDKLAQRLQRRQERSLRVSDDDLEQRARELNRRYFAGRLRWTSITYVTNQNRRYGSCTPSLGTIRISDRVAKMPAWVRDYVLVHELAHLEQANHSARFWKLVNRYPLTERARGYLIALGLEGETDDEAGDDVE